MNMDPESQMGLLLSKYMDDEATPAERDMVEKHVAACGSCRDMLQIFRANDVLLKGSLNVEVFGNQVVEKVMSQVAVKRPAVSISRGAWAAMAAGLVIAALVGILVAQHSTLESMLRRVASVTQRMESMREDHINDLQEMRRELARNEAIHKFEREPGTGLVALPQQEQIKLSFKLGNGVRYEIFRREGSGAWGERFDSTPSREYTDSRVQPDHTYEYRVVALDAKGATIRSEEIKVRVPAEVTPAMIQDRSNFLKISLIAVENQVASIMVSRLVNGQARHEIYQVRAGQEVGSRVPDLTGTMTIDFRTGYAVAAITDGDQPIGVTSRGDQLMRNNKKIVLKPAGATGGESLECWQGSDMMIPLPK